MINCSLVREDCGITTAHKNFIPQTDIEKETSVDEWMSFLSNTTWETTPFTIRIWTVQSDNIWKV